MAIFTYTRSLSSFPSGCAFDRFELEIRQCHYISVALESISQSGLSLDIIFRAELSTPEEAALDQLIAAHSGRNLEDPKNSSGIPYVALFGSSNEVQTVGRDGSQYIAATHDFADKTTWFGDSIRTAEVLTLDISDSSNKTYKSIHPFWIDLTHGKLKREDTLRSSYSVIISVAGVVLSVRPPFILDWSAGGDYYVDYRAGKIIFKELPSEAPDATYSYATTSSWYLFASANTIMDVEKVETQFSQNIDFSDGIMFDAVMSNGAGGYVVVQTIDRYDTVDQVIDTALGSYPAIPAIGGSLRGTVSPTYGFPFEYRTKLPVTSQIGARVRLVNDHEMGTLDGLRSRLTATFYTVVH